MIVREQISLGDLATFPPLMDGDLVKAVVDVRRATLAVAARLHSELEAELLQDGSAQGDVWGINLYPARYGGPDWLEFDSVINLRPRHGNRSGSVDDAETRRAIARIVDRLVQA